MLKKFMDEDFLLSTPAARTLFHNYAENLPIIDYHCHINPADIAEDKQYATITEAWLSGDHYKWRAMRGCGYSEELVTGSVSGDPYGVFEAYADALSRAPGNALYHWSHLELQRYFGITTPLSPATAKEIYEQTNAKLAMPDMSVRGLIDRSNVQLICSTDDPADDLSYHEKIAEDPSVKVTVLPAFRPDRAMNADKAGYPEYIRTLSKACGTEINSYTALVAALEDRVEFFDAHGCRASDHGLDRGIYAEASPEELDAIFRKAADGGKITVSDGDKLRTGLLIELAGMYHRRGWIMQIHFGCMRNINTAMFKRLGPDTGFDAISGASAPHLLAQLLDRFNTEDILPRIVLYSLNEQDNQVLMSIATSFMADAECAGKIQLGSAWWFNDTKTGMQKQLCDFACGGVLGNFIGMLTDSRSFLSYTRHEYFRRILCDFIGTLIDNGEYPADFELAGSIVQDICYYNTVRFFGFDVA